MVCNRPKQGLLVKASSATHKTLNFSSFSFSLRLKLRSSATCLPLQWRKSHPFSSATPTFWPPKRFKVDGYSLHMIHARHDSLEWNLSFVEDHVRGEVKSKDEKEKTDRLRERRKKKLLQGKREKERKQLEKAVDAANPGLGNKHAKERTLRQLQQAEKDGTITVVCHFFLLSVSFFLHSFICRSTLSSLSFSSGIWQCRLLDAQAIRWLAQIDGTCALPLTCSCLSRADQRRRRQEPQIIDGFLRQTAGRSHFSSQHRPRQERETEKERQTTDWQQTETVNKSNLFLTFEIYNLVLDDRAPQSKVDAHDTTLKDFVRRVTLARMLSLADAKWGYRETGWAGRLLFSILAAAGEDKAPTSLRSSAPGDERRDHASRSSWRPRSASWTSDLQCAFGRNIRPTFFESPPAQLARTMAECGPAGRVFFFAQTPRKKPRLESRSERVKEGGCSRKWNSYRLHHFSRLTDNGEPRPKPESRL